MGETTAHAPAPPETVWSALTDLLELTGSAGAAPGATGGDLLVWLPPRQARVARRHRFGVLILSLPLTHFGTRTALSLEHLERSGLWRLPLAAPVLWASRRLLVTRLRRRLRENRSVPPAT